MAAGTYLACFIRRNEKFTEEIEKERKMKKRHVTIIHRKEISGALNRHITNKLFESRILELPQQAMQRISLCPNAPLSNGKK